jgi:hypothetical protein
LAIIPFNNIPLLLRCSNKTVTVASEISLHALPAVASGAGIRAFVLETIVVKEES